MTNPFYRRDSITSLVCKFCLSTCSWHNMIRDDHRGGYYVEGIKCPNCKLTLDSKFVYDSSGYNLKPIVIFEDIYLESLKYL